MTTHSHGVLLKMQCWAGKTRSNTWDRLIWTWEKKKCTGDRMLCGSSILGSVLETSAAPRYLPCTTVSWRFFVFLNCFASNSKYWEKQKQPPNHILLSLSLFLSTTPQALKILHQKFQTGQTHSGFWASETEAAKACWCQAVGWCT